MSRGRTRMGEGMNGNSKGAVRRSLIVSSIQGLAPEVYFYGVGDSRVWCGPGPTQHRGSIRDRERTIRTQLLI